MSKQSLDDFNEKYGWPKRDYKNFDELLEDVLAKVRGFKHDDGIHALSINVAKTAIVEAVEGLIGEDEPEDIEAITLEDGRNSLRAELRQAIKEWQ